MDLLISHNAYEFFQIFFTFLEIFLKIVESKRNVTNFYMFLSQDSIFHFSISIFHITIFSKNRIFINVKKLKKFIRILKNQ